MSRIDDSSARAAGRTPTGSAAAPPTTPGRVRTKGPAVWPVGLGTLMVVFSVLGIMQGISGAFTPLMMGTFERVPGLEHMAVLADYGRELLVSSVIFGVLAALLGWAGILMMTRRPLTRRISMIWAILKLLGLVIQVVLNTIVMRAMWSAMQLPFGPGLRTGLAVVFAALVFVVGIALPIFLLVWFSRRSVQQEMASWGASPHAGAGVTDAV